MALLILGFFKYLKILSFAIKNNNLWEINFGELSPDKSIRLIDVSVTCKCTCVNSSLVPLRVKI